MAKYGSPVPVATVALLESGGTNQAVIKVNLEPDNGLLRWQSSLMSFAGCAHQNSRHAAKAAQHRGRGQCHARSNYGLLIFSEIAFSFFNLAGAGINNTKCGTASFSLLVGSSRGIDMMCNPWCVKIAFDWRATVSETPDYNEKKKTHHQLKTSQFYCKTGTA